MSRNLLSAAAALSLCASLCLPGGANASEPPADPPPADTPPGTTPPPQERATELAREGAKYAAAGQFAEAASKFQQSLLVFPMTDVYYNLAYVYEQMGDWKGCVDNYTLYLGKYRADHDGADPPEIAGVNRSIEKCKETAQPPITITTTPDGAQVAVESMDKIIGTTPLTQKMEPGTYKIFVVKEGYTPVETQIVVQPKQPGKFHFDLRQVVNTGKVRIVVNVKEATIYIDGKNYGLSPYLETPELEVGRHQVVVKKERYTSVNSTFEVRKGETTELVYDLFLSDPPPSWRSYLGWASVSIGALAIAGGIVAYKFADAEFNDTDDFKQLQLLQNIGYGVGGGLLGIGTGLLIWEAVSDAVDDDDLIQAGDVPFNLGFVPTDGGMFFSAGGRF